MLSLAALSLSAAGFFASSATLSRTADAGRAGTPISLANAVTNFARPSKPGKTGSPRGDPASAGRGASVQLKQGWEPRSST